MVGRRPPLALSTNTHHGAPLPPDTVANAEAVRVPRADTCSGMSTPQGMSPRPIRVTAHIMARQGRPATVRDPEAVRLPRADTCSGVGTPQWMVHDGSHHDAPRPGRDWQGSRVLTPDQTWARLSGCCREGTPTSLVPSSDVRGARRPEFTQWPAPVRRGCEAMQATGLTRPFSRPHAAGRARRAAGRRWRVGVERCEPGGRTPSPGARRASPSAGAPGACGTAPDRVAPRVRSRWGRPVGRVRPAPVGGAGLGGWFGQGS